MRILPALFAALAVAASGCFGGADNLAPAGDGGTGGSGDLPPPKKDVPKPRRDPNLRWHYHNYWGASDSLLLLDANLTLPIVRADRLSLAPRTATIDFTLPYGRIVPPETGEINVTITFFAASDAAFTGLNFSYRPGGAVNFTGMPIVSGQPITLPVSYDQTDVPHRGTSAWKFRLGPETVNGLAFANGTARVVLEAKIGRPLLIDPPHFDQWRGRTAIPLAALTANVSAVKIADDRYGRLDVTRQVADVRAEVMEIPLPNGSLVPDGTREVVVHLFWNTTGGVKPALGYAEDNSPSNGTLQPTADGATMREYRIPIEIGMADSPYANQSTWRFFVLIEGTPGTPLTGVVTLHATAERRS